MITWSTAAAFIATGVVLFSEAMTVGRAMLALGILSVANEGLRLRADRTSSVYERFRLVLAVVYVALVLIGFLVFVYASEMPLPFM